MPGPWEDYAPAPDIGSMVTAAAQRHGVSPDLAMRVARQESGLRANSVSPKGARGPMQLMPATARELGVDPDDPAQNIDGGVRYLAQQLKAFNGDERLALAAYNAGPGAVQRYGGVPPFAETQAYVEAISPEQGPWADYAPSDTPDAAPQGGGISVQALPNVPGYVSDPTYQAPQGHEGEIAWQAPAVPLGGPTDPARNAGDVALGFLGGVQRAGAGIADQVSQSMLGPLTMLRTAADLASGAAPSAAPLSGFARATDQIAYDPTTTAGRAAQTLGEMVPNAAFGAGGLVQRGANVALPAIGAETAAAGVRAAGGGEGMQDIARMVGGVGGGLATGLRVNQRGPAPAPARPVNDVVADLRGQKKAAYDAVEAAGFRFSQGDLRALAKQLRADLRARSGVPAAGNSNEAYGFVNRIEALSRQKGGATLGQLDAIRQDIWPMLQEAGGSNSIYGGMIKSGIDALVDANANASPLMAAARDANTRWAKADEIAKRVRSAELRAGAAHSGENLSNTVSQQLRPTIDPMSGQRIRNLTPDETTALDRLVVGDDTHVKLRSWEKRLRNPIAQGGIGGASTVGGALGGAIGGMFGGAPGAAIGAGIGAPLGGRLAYTSGQKLREIAEGRRQLQLQELIEMIASGGSAPASRPGLIGHRANFPAIVAASPSLSDLLASVPADRAGTRP